MRSRAELYDWEVAHVARRGDLDFYAALAERTGGPVLELGCGTGRLTLPLDAVGLDLDPEMLAVARARGARRLVRADMRRFFFRARFNLVVIAYNTLQLLLDEEDRVDCLRCAAAHMAPHGLVALEVTDFQAGATVRTVEPELLTSAGGVTLYGGLVHDFGRRVTTYYSSFEEAGQTRMDHVRLRCLNRSELESLLGAAGLHLVKAKEDSRRLFAVAAAR